MIDIKNMTKAVEQILVEGTEGYTIRRNEARNLNPNAAFDGWIGIYKDAIEFQVARIGPNKHNADISIQVECQYASIDQEKLEDKLGEMENEVLVLLMDVSKKKLPLNAVNQVDQLVEVSTDYNIFAGGEDQETLFFQSTTITFTYRKIV